MKGYWNQPQATAAAIVEGWLHSGDTGFVDEQRIQQERNGSRVQDAIERGCELRPVAQHDPHSIAGPHVMLTHVSGEPRGWIRKL